MSEWKRISKGEIPNRFQMVMCPAKYSDVSDCNNYRISNVICKYDKAWKTVEPGVMRRSEEYSLVPVYCPYGVFEYIETELDLWKPYPQVPDEFEEIYDEVNDE